MTPASSSTSHLQSGTQAILNNGPKKLLINGEWLPALSGETFATLNPASGTAIAEVALAVRLMWTGP